MKILKYNIYSFISGKLDYLINALILFTIFQNWYDFIPRKLMKILIEYTYLRWKKVVVKKEEGTLIMKDLN